MEVVFLGTGAAEGVPAAYCRCSDCSGVRARGGREVKSRSSIRIGKHYQVDISPDHYWQMLRHGLDMYDLEHVLISHTHEDHFALPGLTDKTMAKETNDKPLAVYLSKPGRDYLDRILKALSISDRELAKWEGRFHFVGVDYFGTYTVGELTVETVKANHTTVAEGEYAVSYLVTLPNGRRLLYALDTGYYLDETWEYLTGKRIDSLIMDCTFAGRTDRGEYPAGHLDLASFMKMLGRMSETGFIDADTGVYATHFNPHQGLTHDEIQQAFDESPFSVTVAYDGLRVGG